MWNNIKTFLSVATILLLTAFCVGAFFWFCSFVYNGGLQFLNN
jgi:hypothetical protein